MEESHSETSSELEQVIAHRDEVMNMLKWNAAIVAILLEQAGGVAEVTREDLERVDLSKVNATVEYDQERDMYVIKGVYDDDAV